MGRPFDRHKVEPHVEIPSGRRLFFLPRGGQALAARVAEPSGSNQSRSEEAGAYLICSLDSPCPAISPFESEIARMGVFVTRGRAHGPAPTAFQYRPIPLDGVAVSPTELQPGDYPITPARQVGGGLRCYPNGRLYSPTCVSGPIMLLSMLPLRRGADLCVDSYSNFRGATRRYMPQYIFGAHSTRGGLL